MAKYTYKGPSSGVTLPDGREVLFHDEQDVDLPEDNTYVQGLVARGHLIPVAPAVPFLTPQAKSKVDSPKGDN